jgi:hypothetical protein
VACTNKTKLITMHNTGKPQERKDVRKIASNLVHIMSLDAKTALERSATDTAGDENHQRLADVCSVSRVTSKYSLHKTG